MKKNTFWKYSRELKHELIVNSKSIGCQNRKIGVGNIFFLFVIVKKKNIVLIINLYLCTRKSLYETVQSNFLLCFLHFFAMGISISGLKMPINSKTRSYLTTHRTTATETGEKRWDWHITKSVWSRTGQKIYWETGITTRSLIPYIPKFAAFLPLPLSKFWRFFYFITSSIFLYSF